MHTFSSGIEKASHAAWSQPSIISPHHPRGSSCPDVHFDVSVPEDFDIDPHSGHHSDRSHRMELKRSCIEYIAPSEYMVSY